MINRLNLETLVQYSAEGPVKKEMVVTESFKLL